MAKDIPPYTTPDDFFFKTPPYDALMTTEDDIGGLFYSPLRVDGYCPYCQQGRTFSRTHGNLSHTWLLNYEPDKDIIFHEIRLTCARHDDHILRFNLLIAKRQISKTGQFPSFADIALDESKLYSKLLGKQDTAEFHRAIGLAAHNVGIGSFVYLRRIFERLIERRFKDFKEAEGWKDEQFHAVRMDDKITLLKDHLPPFLVKNAKIYSILSVGIHALDENQCLAFFPVLRQSLILILEEDKKKMEELEMQKQLETAISGFSKPQPQSLSELGKGPASK